jgi:alginate O-acetyltransferase complex protein AlgI
LIARFGLQGGSLLAFLFSGMIHELVITVPARGGWGRPTLYFLIQGIALQLERSRAGRRIGLGTGRIGWLFTGAITVVPVGLLFPEQFIRDVIAPFLRELGGLP